MQQVTMRQRAHRVTRFVILQFIALVGWIPVRFRFGGRQQETQGGDKPNTSTSTNKGSEHSNRERVDAIRGLHYRRLSL